MSSGQRSFRIGPPQRNTFIAGLSLAQIICIAVALVGSLGLIRLLPFGVAAPIAIVLSGVCLALGFLPIGGRRLDEWAPALIAWFRRTNAGTRRTFISPTPLVGEVIGKGGRSVPPPVLAGVKIMKVGLEGGRELGIIKDGKEGTYSAVIEVRSETFALLDAGEQERRLSAWASVLANCAREGTAIHRLQWIERAIPEDGDAIEGYLREHIALPSDHPLVESYRNLIEQAGPVTQQHQIFIVVQVSTVRSHRALRQHTKGGASTDEGACEILVREIKNLENVMRQADLRVVGALNSRDVAYHLRTAFDPAAVRKLAARAQGDEDLKGTAPRNAWPMATEVKWNSYRTDGSHHATFWVAEWPRIDAPADFLAPLLLQTRCDRVVSVVMEPVSPSKALRDVEQAHTTYIADQEIRDRAGYTVTARRKREYEALMRKEQELADGHAAYRFSAYVSVTAENDEQLEWVSTEVEQAAHMSRLDLRRCWGEQDTAFCCTLPLGRGLR
ncbi:MAG: PrgI family protein [Acidimicrobiia bacterium]